MTKKLKALYLKYHEIIHYILVGGGTTVVAWGCKYLCNLFFFDGTSFPGIYQITVLSIVENIAAIAYAYPANRKWVFHSTNPRILEELLKFSGSRAFVCILGWILNMLMVNVMGINVFLSTLLAGLIGGVVNFTLLKLVIFCHRDRGTERAKATIIPSRETVSLETDFAPAA